MSLTALSIILIDVVLSGDNCLLIAMAVQALPPHQRRRGIVIGAGGAAAMRITFTWFASRLMQTPFLELVGGLLILWIAGRLLVQNEETQGAGGPGKNLWHAIRIIMLADASMSLDNVLAVAGVAQGDARFLWFGLGLSIPLVVFASSFLVRLMGRFPIIVTVGAALLGRVGGGMVVADPFFRPWFSPSDWVRLSGEAVGVMLVLCVGFWVPRRRSVTAPAHRDRSADGLGHRRPAPAGGRSLAGAFHRNGPGVGADGEFV
jgi:YjbE family integral membrane protein